MATIISFSPNTPIKSADINTNFANLANGSAMNSPIFDSMSVTNLKQVSGLYDNGNSGASPTVDWSKGDRQKITISAAATLVWANAVAGQVLTLEMIENGTGNFTIALPSMKWPGGSAATWTTSPNALNILTVLFDGTNYLAQGSAGYA